MDEMIQPLEQIAHATSEAASNSSNEAKGSSDEFKPPSLIAEVGWFAVDSVVSAAVEAVWLII
ncbi:MAG: hypothetical protein FJW36_15280 [Acidobacteria bacterium]|nr:hypothetical protein [Acidobacteriota bacterium]